MRPSPRRPLVTALLAHLLAATARTTVQMQAAEAQADVQINALLVWKSKLPKGGCLGCGDGPLFSLWSAGTDVCGWLDFVQVVDGRVEERGVSRCNSTTQVFTKLDLSGMNLRGLLPVDFSSLSLLKDLVLSQNSFTGSLPAEYSALGRETPELTIRLDENVLTGTLPVAWSSYPRKIQLDLQTNFLTGTLPAEWSTLRIEKMEISDNLLSGTLPSTWAESTELSSVLERLEMDGNELRGTLPLSWSKFTKLEKLKLRENYLEGTLPQAWSEMSVMDNLRLDRNKLTGPLLANMSMYMKELELNDNHFTGSLPAEWSVCVSLEEVHLINNDLTGTIPSEWSVLASSKLDTLELRGNMLHANYTMPWYPAGWNMATQRPHESDAAVPLYIVLLCALAALCFAVLLGVLLWCLWRKRRSIVTPLAAASGMTVGIPVSHATTGYSLGNSKFSACSSMAPGADRQMVTLRRLASQEYRTNPEIDGLYHAIADLHLGMPEWCKTLNLRVLKRSFLKNAQYLPCYEELETAWQDGYVDVPYGETGEKFWKSVLVVSWRWSQQKPASLLPGFSPMSDLQLDQLQLNLENKRSRVLQYIWIDWACVPQYSASPMPEIARSKLYYGRARAMCVLPATVQMPEGSFRVVLASIIRALQDPVEMAGCDDTDVKMASVTLARLQDDLVYFGRGYFGRVWTLAERMARHGRDERLKHWMSLDIWLGMTLDAAWASSTPDGEAQSLADASDSTFVSEFYWDKLFDAPVARRGVDALTLLRKNGSHMVSASINREVAMLFVNAVDVWRTRCVTEEVNAQWLRRYLAHEAGMIYRSFDARDSVWAIYSFFCWHVRDPDEFDDALSDLCRIAHIEPGRSKLLALCNAPSSHKESSSSPSIAF